MNRFHRHFPLAAVSLLLLFLNATTGVSQRSTKQHTARLTKGSLADVRDMRRALLLVFSSRVVDATSSDRSVIEQVLKTDPQPKTGRSIWVYGQIARKLNSYIRKYKSIKAAYDLDEAEFVIYFNIIEYRRFLNTIYPYGELFVIVKGSPELQNPPRIVWKTRKIVWANDAIGDLIKDLKSLHGVV
jgi:hypothetical protein